MSAEKPPKRNRPRKRGQPGGGAKDFDRTKTSQSDTMDEVERALDSRGSLANMDMRGWDLRATDLCGADLHHSDLRGANLRSVDLRLVDLAASNLSDADMRYANLSGADLRGADLRGANLTDAVMSYANLSGADLRGADLPGANLNDANLTYADLRWADLRYADLFGANLHGFQVMGARLTYTKFDRLNLQQLKRALKITRGLYRLRRFGTFKARNSRSTAGMKRSEHPDYLRRILSRTRPPGRGNLVLLTDGGWNVEQLAALMSSFSQAYDDAARFLVGNAPIDPLAIRSLRMASPGGINFQGSGEILEVFRKLIDDISGGGLKFRRKTRERAAAHQATMDQIREKRAGLENDRLAEEIKRLAIDNERQMVQIVHEALATLTLATELNLTEEEMDGARRVLAMSIGNVAAKIQEGVAGGRILGVTAGTENLETGDRSPE